MVLDPADAELARLKAEVARLAQEKKERAEQKRAERERREREERERQEREREEREERVGRARRRWGEDVGVQEGAVRCVEERA